MDSKAAPAKTLNEDDHPKSRGRKAKEWAVHGMARFIVMFLYLWVIFGLFVLNETIVLRKQGANFTAHGFAFINALILAKVMLVAEDLELGRWLKYRPLIYRIIFETFIFTVLFVCFHVIEELIVGLINGRSVAASLPSFGGGGMVGLICVALILFISLMPFFAFGNISRELGPGWLKTMLFSSRRKADDHKA
jgi:hypothetical protein